MGHLYLVVTEAVGIQVSHQQQARRAERWVRTLTGVSGDFTVPWFYEASAFLNLYDLYQGKENKRGQTTHKGEIN